MDTNLHELVVIDRQLELHLPDGVQFERKSLKLRDDLTYDEWVDVGKFLAESEKSLNFWLSDYVAYGRRRFGDEKVRGVLAQLDFQVKTLRNALDLDKLGFTDPDLDEVHHIVLARSNLDDVAVKMWAELAKKEIKETGRFSGAELQESIKKGHVVRIKQEPHDGAAGVSTWQGLSMQFDLMRRQVGDEWKNWSVEQIDGVLGKLSKIQYFIQALEEQKKNL